VRPATGTPIVGRLTVVSRSSSRAELPTGGPRVDIGTEAEVLVPEARFAATPAEPVRPGSTAPAHPPWEAPLPNVEEGLPLLAPVDRIRREERPTSWSGRVFSRIDASWSNGESYTLAEVGLETRIENPFHEGGVLRFRGLANVAPVPIFSGDGSNDSESDVRLERFSYRSNDDEDQQLRWEVGRFLPNALPELGLFDGGVLELELGGGQEIGMGAGALPDPFDYDFTSEDPALFVYHGLRFGDLEEFRFTWAYQKTWHEGDADRDLVLGVLDWRISDAWSLHGSLWVDYYGGDADFKSSGFELTEAQLSTSYRFDADTGIGAGYSSIRWPELLRQEFRGVPSELLEDGHLQRIYASAYRNFGEHLRVDGRIDHWNDTDESGTGGDLRFALRELFWTSGEISATFFHTEGVNTEGNGLRLRAQKSWSDVALFGGYEISKQQFETSFGDEDDAMLHALNADFTWYLTRDLDLTLRVDRRFGEQQDAWSLGFYTQLRF
jgi:hypothetical protein